MARNLKLITFHVPEKMLEQIKLMLDRKLYPNRSELIRVAVRDLLKREGMWGQTRSMEFPIGKPLDEIDDEDLKVTSLYKEGQLSKKINNEVEQHG